MYLYDIGENEVCHNKYYQDPERGDEESGPGRVCDDTEHVGRHPPVVHYHDVEQCDHRHPEIIEVHQVVEGRDARVEHLCRLCCDLSREEELPDACIHIEDDKEGHEKTKESLLEAIRGLPDDCEVFNLCEELNQSYASQCECQG